MGNNTFRYILIQRLGITYLLKDNTFECITFQDKQHYNRVKGCLQFVLLFRFVCFEYDTFLLDVPKQLSPVVL